jgi:hypothetical protein
VWQKYKKTANPGRHNISPDTIHQKLLIFAGELHPAWKEFRGLLMI